MDQRVELLEQSVQSLSGGQEGIAKRLEELFSQLNSRMDRLSIQSSPGKGVEYEAHTPESRTNLTRSGSTSYTPKLVKLDFPRFDEKEDPSSWVCRAEQFFQFHHTLDDERVEIASFHLVGDAQLWYQLLKQENPVITWADFKEGFYARYGPNQLVDYFGELSKLQQRRTVQMYQTQFEKLLAKVGPLSQARQVGCFVSGLISSIRTNVQANRPKSLSEAIALARLYEARNSVQVKGTSTTSRPAFQTSRPSPVISQLAANPIKRLTWEELNERKKLGLCFKCNEKFGLGHRCKKLFSIQAVLEESDDDMEMEIEEQDQTEVPAISLHAISGFEGPDKMRLRGKLANQFGTILVDSGSTHNFVSEKFARKAGIEPTTSKKIKVLVASGEELMSSGKCTQTEILIQGVPIIVDLYILPLEGYDVVLGTQWLRTLGTIIWDFSDLLMTFNLDGKQVILQGSIVPDNQLISAYRMEHLIQFAKKGFLLQIIGDQSDSPEIPKLHPQIQAFLDKFRVVANEPVGLPPQWLHDHKIPLKNSEPISVRPYRYPHYQ
ncbi:uncharacterized protein LOC110603257 [Manihot esculenta]|uniref:uncharacterized protein LOC110603257 n=1 Tax=Manihot esculenta TaxID=3983 RepID=UPI000B5D2F71|nr:uncharacterized protein LOC110603257 [Manihot esculenta]